MKHQTQKVSLILVKQTEQEKTEREEGGSLKRKQLDGLKLDQYTLRMICFQSF